MKKGYFPLQRKIVDNVFWKEKRVYSKFEAWLDMLLEARYLKTPDKVIIKMKEITCNYGESLNSIETWSNRWNWSRSKVSRFFGLLKKNKKIETHNEIHTTRLTILNYHIYNSERNGDETEMKRLRNACETLADTEEEGSNKVNHNIIIGDFANRVHLTDDELNRLVADYGEEPVKNMILDMDEWFTDSKNYKSKTDHNKTMYAWFRRRGVNKINENKQNQPHDITNDIDYIECKKCGRKGILGRAYTKCECGELIKGRQ